MKVLSFSYLTAMILGLSLSVGCSQRWIETDAELDGASLMEQIAAVQTAAEGSGNSSAMSTFNSLVQSETSYIYYVDGPSPMGNALSAASLVNFNILGRSDVSDLDITQAVVIYVEDFTSEGWKSALLVQVDVEGESLPITQVFESIQSPTVNDKEYVAFMGNNGNHTVSLRSFYTSGDELQSVVQFRVFEVSAGQEAYIGKFGAMASFGGGQ